jgi:hypothetical protein
LRTRYDRGKAEGSDNDTASTHRERRDNVTGAQPRIDERARIQVREAS